MYLLHNFFFGVTIFLLGVVFCYATISRYRCFVEHALCLLIMGVIFCRSKNEFAKVEQKVEAMPINPSGEKVDSYPSGHRGPRNADRKDYRRDTDRADAYRPTRREDNRKVVEKLPEQQRPEPETWRKPVEPPKPEITAPRFGKAATALELAQAFSKSMSDTVPQSRLTSVPSPRVPPSPGTRDQVGFSRLTDNGALHSGSSHRKINGY
jgi:hypothetical protein